MITAQADVVLKHLCGLVAAETLGRLSDEQLLERFTTGKQEAFEVLVRRHGPLVLGVCRRVLHHQHDAEDAFQATFWTLARAAGSVGKRGSLGGWLHRVAFRVALKARARAANRQKFERKAGQQPAADPLTEVTGRELVTVLDEELHRLPEHLQTPLVLCYLQGKTRDEAARQLGWPLGTLKRRLEQGKESLRVRLARRGLALPAVLLAAGLTPGAEGAVPQLLAASAVRRVLDGGVSAEAVSLAQGALKTAWANHLKLAVCVLLAGVLALGGYILAAGFTAGRPAAARGPKGQTGAKLPPAARPGPSPRKHMTVVGRVLGADGKGVAGAAVAVVGRPRAAGRGGDFSTDHDGILGETKTDTDGRFHLKVARTSSATYYHVYALAGGKGHGLGWHKLNPDAEQPEALLRLEAEQALKGRLVDLQGQPAAGVKVHVSNVGESVNGEWEGVSSFDVPSRLTCWPKPAVTDAAGRFVVTGLSPLRGALLSILDDRFAHQGLYVDPKWPRRVLAASLSPAQIIEGTVVFADTGKPAAHARLTVYASNNSFGGGGGIDGKADARGRFRLNPLPGKYFDVSAYAPDGQPYLTLQKRLTWPRGAIKQELKLALPRGVMVRGKITETPSGKPVAAASVQFTPRTVNNRYYRQDVVTGWQGIAVSGPDGVFQIAVLPGPGHLMVTGPTLDYIHQEVGARVLDSGQPGGLRYQPDALVKLDLAPGAKTKEVAVKLRRGVTVKGRLIGRDGKPVERALMICRLHVSALSPYWRFPVEVQGGRFELRGCDPKQRYPVYFLDPKNRTGAAVTLAGSQAGKPVTVRLKACGQATVRFVDPRGKPLANIAPWIEIVVTPGPSRYDLKASEKGLLSADGDYLANVDRLNYWKRVLTDKDGRCTLPALIPGVTYTIGELGGDRPVKKEFTVEAGKTRDLGEIRRMPSE